MKTIQTFLCALFLCLSSQAQTVHSAYITQERISDFEIKANFFLLVSKSDSNFKNSDFTANISCPATGKVIEITGLNQIDKKSKPVSCSESDNVWQFHFQKTVNLDDSKFLSLKNCFNLRLDLQVCCRDSNLNTIDNSNNSKFYVFTELVNSGSNINENSVQLTSIPLISACLNTPYFLNLGAYDAFEYDSLSFKLSSPLEGNSQAITYKSGLSSTSPLKIYDPTGQGKINPHSNPPVGFFLDSLTGDIIFTPIKQDQKSTMALLIGEWRPDSSGKMTQVGKTLVEIGSVINTCPGNNPPIINGPFTHEVCAGEIICFFITSDDKVKVPPPPATPPAPDTVTLKWGRGIPSATFTIMNPKELHQTGRFCWTPKVEEANVLPYSFTVTARDNFCPLNLTTVRAFSVKVHAQPDGDSKLNRISGTQYIIDYLDSSHVKPTSQKINLFLRDSAGNQIFNPNIAHFSSTGSSNSTKASDTIVINKNGTYIVQTTITNYPGACPTDLYDTLSHYSLGSPPFSNNVLVLYPNPANEIVHFGVRIGAQSQLPNLLLEEITLFDNLGQIVLKQNDANYINVKYISPGLYLIHGRHNNQDYRGKLVVVRD